MSDPNDPSPQGPDPERQQSPYGNASPVEDALPAPLYAPPQYAAPPAMPQYAPPAAVPPQYAVLPVGPRPRTNGAGVAAMVCGIVAAVVGVWTLVPFLGIVAGIFAFLPAVAAVILGHIGMSAYARLDTGRGMSLSGLVLGYGTLALIIGVILFWVWAISTGANSVDPYYW